MCALKYLSVPDFQLGYLLAMQMNPFLFFDGRCEEAFRFYEQCLGARITLMMTYEGTPMADQAPPEWGKKLLHATLDVGGQVLQGGDIPPGGYEPPRGMGITLSLQDPPEAERIFQALSENGKVGMPLQQTFWALRFGMVVDRFGTPWMINCG